MKLKALIVKAQDGDEDALFEVIQRFIPMVKKYSRQLGYVEAFSDLITWIVGAVHRYKPRIMQGKGELEKQ